VTTRLAVVGHVEWVDFVRAGRLPSPGEIVAAREAWEAPAGGGAMAAYALQSLTGAATFFSAVGDDARGEACVAGLRATGVDVRAAVHAGAAQPRTVTWLTDDHERTITTLGRPGLEPRGADALPWEDLAACDGVVLFAGDAGAVRASRAAGVLVATARVRDALLEADVTVDALVGSAGDALERIDDALIAATRPRWIVTTEGARGGAWRPGPGHGELPGRWLAAPPPASPVDAFGCGDAFAATLMAGLARGDDIATACARAADAGAALLCERAPAVGDLSSLWGS
jgi:ribokinase